MTLDALLASLKNGVSEVTGVQASEDKAFARNPGKWSGVAEVSGTTTGTKTATPETPPNPTGVSPKPASLLACTRETPVTPKSLLGEAEAPRAGAGESTTGSCWWLIHYAERDPVEVACCPEAAHAEILERYPDAIAVESFEPNVRQPSDPMTTEEEKAIRAWLELIEETDPNTIAEALRQCRRDADVREYFTKRAAAELPDLDPSPTTGSPTASVRTRSGGDAERLDCGRPKL